MSPDPEPREVQLPSPSFDVNVAINPAGDKVVVLSVHIPMTAEAAKRIAVGLAGASQAASMQLIVPDGAVSAEDALAAFERAQEDGGS
jgi:hypothetical protein